MSTRKKDPKAIALLGDVTKLIEKYVRHVTNPRIPSSVNYRLQEGRALQREARGLLKEEREGWID